MGYRHDGRQRLRCRDAVSWRSVRRCHLGDVYGGGTPNNLVDSPRAVPLDATYAIWAAKPANVEHYYLYENFTLGNPTPALGATTASGYGWSVADTIAFAKEHDKPFGIDEAGATSGQDDAVFPAWLASTIAGVEAEGVTVDHVDIWSNGTSTYDFVNGERPNEAAAWVAGFGAGSSSPTDETPTISLSAPGTVQEPSVGAGVIVTETITTTNLTGNVYEEVLTSSGAVESGYRAVALINHVATSSVFLAKSGDKIQVVDNPTLPTVTADSPPVTITEPPVTPPPSSRSEAGPIRWRYRFPRMRGMATHSSLSRSTARRLAVSRLRPPHMRRVRHRPSMCWEHSPPAATPRP